MFCELLYKLTILAGCQDTNFECEQCKLCSIKTDQHISFCESKKVVCAITVTCQISQSKVTIITLHTALH